MYIYFLVKNLYPNKRTLIKKSTERKWRNFHYILIINFKISLVENQCLPFRSRLQMFFKVGTLKSYAIFTEKHLRWGVFHWIFQNFKTSFFIEHLRCLPLHSHTTFQNYYWKDRLVILFTLTHPYKQLNTCFEADTGKGI